MLQFSYFLMKAKSFGFLVALATVTLFSLPVQAQSERTNSALPVFSDAVVWSLNKATGWIKNSEGQWLEGQNKVQRKAMSIDDKDEWEKEINSVGLDNFIQYEIREMAFAGIGFLLFTKRTTVDFRSQFKS